MTKHIHCAIIYRVIAVFAITAFGFMAIVGTGSGGGESGTTSVLSDAQVMEKTRTLLDDIETDAAASDKAVYETIDKEVMTYSFPAAIGARAVATQETPSEYLLDPENAAELYRMFGVVAFLQGSMKGALWASLKAVLHGPDTAANLAQVGTVLNEMERYEEAIQYLLKAKSLDEDSDTLMMSLGYSYSSLGDYAEAETALSRAIDINPDGMIQRDVIMGRP